MLSESWYALKIPGFTWSVTLKLLQNTVYRESSSGRSSLIPLNLILLELLKWLHHSSISFPEYCNVEQPVSVLKEVWLWLENSPAYPLIVALVKTVHSCHLNSKMLSGIIPFSTWQCATVPSWYFLIPKQVHSLNIARIHPSHYKFSLTGSRALAI